MHAHRNVVSSVRQFIAYGVKLGLKELDLALLAARLNEDVEEDRITLEEIKRQMAAVRDLLRKYHEQAGELQIDFSREDDPTNEKDWEDAHAVKWVKNQLDKTAKKEAIRNEWRSNAFDLEGMDSIKPPTAQAAAPKTPSKDANKAPKVNGVPVSSEPEKVIDNSRAEETPAEAAAQGKPMVTDHALVEDAAQAVNRGDGYHLYSEPMESKIGQAAVRKTDDTKEQMKMIEKRID